MIDLKLKKNIVRI